MRELYEIYDAVHEMILAEMRAIVRHRLTGSRKLFWEIDETRSALLSLLEEAADSRDLWLLLQIEREFMRLDLEHIAHARENIRRLRAGLRQINKAIPMLDYVDNPSGYHWAGIFYTLSEDLVGNSELPKDAMHRFFASHKTRLENIRSGSDHQNKTALLNARESNMDLAKKLYMDLQRRALAAPEIREPAMLYRVDLQPKLAA